MYVLNTSSCSQAITLMILGVSVLTNVKANKPSSTATGRMIVRERGLKNLHCKPLFALVEPLAIVRP
jgi:hypothetical protein